MKALITKIIKSVTKLFAKKQIKHKTIVTGLERPRVALVVGHTKKSKGAVTVTGVSEFDFWAERLEKEWSGRLEYKTFYRKSDGAKGIEEAYKEAESWGADCLIEFHFNAFNKIAEGCETLCSYDSDDYEFATMIQTAQHIALKNKNRGVKRMLKSERGGRSVSAFAGPNCLVEPFFGDNTEDFTNFLQKEDAYFSEIHEAICRRYNV